MGKITIQEIANKLIAQNGLSKKEATLFGNMMFETVREALERDKTVKVKGLGTFKIIDVESRESVNVNTGERVLIEGHNKITFTPDALMKELVNKPFSQFETVVLNDGVDFKGSNEEETPDVEETPEVDEGENGMAEMPLVDFIAPDPIDLGEKVEPEKTINPVVAETPVIPGTPVVPETPEIPEVSEVMNTPEIQETPEIPTELEADNPVLPEEPDDKPSVVKQSVVESSVKDSSFKNVYMEEEEDEEEEDVTGGMRWPRVLLACLISLLVGYLLGNYLPWSRQTEPTEVPALKTEKVKEAAPAKKKDAKPIAEPVKQPEAKVEAPQPPVAQKPVEAPKPQPVATAPAEVKLDKYEAMDARVRTGAYRIVGLDYKVEANEGDNILRITHRTLGPGMECYIEVFNGLTTTSKLKKGQEIMIPKVVYKKKLKVQK